MPLDVFKIVEGLRFLRDTDGQELSVFGADGHGYERRPPADEADLVEFERRQGLRLPEDYRRFLIEVGNGGAGPYYGILGLDELCETTEGSRGDLSKPFPHRRKWDGPPEIVKAMEDATADEDDERLSQLTEQYWLQAARRDGSITICEYGCGAQFLLIVNGPESGRIWFDDTADLRGYRPVAVDPAAPPHRYGSWCTIQGDVAPESRVDFAQWYHCWLDWACRVVRAR
jgi:hypothetical protein